MTKLFLSDIQAKKRKQWMRFLDIITMITVAFCAIVIISLGMLTITDARYLPDYFFTEGEKR